MKGRIAAAGLVALLLLAGCGGSGTSRPVHHQRPVYAATECQRGVMGGCVPRPLASTAPAPALATAASYHRLIPDVSEYQACRLYGPTTVRLYEAGTGREDSTVRCHSAELKRLRTWEGSYYFARPYNGTCTSQADRAASIARTLPLRPSVVIVDAEVSLPSGYVRCADAAIKAAGFAYANYVSPGLAGIAGGPFQRPLWIADYGVSSPPACVEGICGRVAWQFSGGYPCAGVYGDCSYDEGLTELGRVVSAAEREAAKRAAVRRQEVAAVATLNRYQRGTNCRRLWRAHGRTAAERRRYRWCEGWEGEKLRLQRRLG